MTDPSFPKNPYVIGVPLTGDFGDELTSPEAASETLPLPLPTKSDYARTPNCFYLCSGAAH
jgi:hypothetical protein